MLNQQVEREGGRVPLHTPGGEQRGYSWTEGDKEKVVGQFDATSHFGDNKDTLLPLYVRQHCIAVKFQRE